MEKDQKSLRKQFLAERDRMNATLTKLRVVHAVCLMCEEVLNKDGVLPEETDLADLLFFVNDLFEKNLEELAGAWRQAQRIYDDMMQCENAPFFSV